MTGVVTPAPTMDPLVQASSPRPPPQIAQSELHSIFPQHAKVKRTLTTRIRDKKSSLPSLGESVAMVLTPFTRFRRRYSLDKLHALEKYRRSTSRCHVAAVILATPLLGLFCAVLPALIPLQDPSLGIFHNYGFLLHFLVISFTVAWSSTVMPRCASGLTSEQFPLAGVLGIATFVAALTILTTGVIAYLWRFPIPFTVPVTFSPGACYLFVGHVLILGKQVLVKGPLRDSVLSGWIWLLVGASQILIYPAFTAGFEAVDELVQVLLTLVFPLLKHVFKKFLRLTGMHFNDFNEERAVSTVELSATLYQSIIMQNNPSFVALAIIIAADVLQGIVSVKLFMDKPSPTPHHKIVPNAIAFLNERGDGSASGESSIEVQRIIRKLTIVPSMVAIQPEPHAPPISLEMTQNAALDDSSAQTSCTDMDSFTDRELNVIQALEILQAAETILLVEYFEVAVPIVNAIFLVIAAQMDSARYNPKLAPFYEDIGRLTVSLRSLALYSFLQGISVVAMITVMRYRYGMSATTHLAFVLEHHCWTIQPTFIGWLPVIMHFPLVHYGAWTLIWMCVMM